MAFVPYNINKQTSDEGVKRSNDLGDVTMLANYKLLDVRSADKHNNRISQQLWVGGGLKLHTGKFAADPNEIIPEANNQPGTGSVDYLLNAMYTFHINDWGINSNINYKINSSAKDFQFGNRLSTSAFIFHSTSLAKVTFNLNVWVLYDKLQANKLNSKQIEETGGNALFAAAVLETNFTKMAIGFNAQVPLSQNLSNG